MRWEYKSVTYNKTSFLSGSLHTEELETLLNELGRDGWELVSAAPNPYFTRSRGLILFLKRQR